MPFQLFTRKGRESSSNIRVLVVYEKDNCLPLFEPVTQRRLKIQGETCYRLADTLNILILFSCGIDFSFVWSLLIAKLGRHIGWSKGSRWLYLVCPYTLSSIPKHRFSSMPRNTAYVYPWGIRSSRLLTFGSSRMTPTTHARPSRKCKLV